MTINFPPEVWGEIMLYTSPAYYPILLRLYPALVPLLRPITFLRYRYEIFTKYINKNGPSELFKHSHDPTRQDAMRQIIFQHFKEKQISHFILDTAFNEPHGLQILIKNQRARCKLLLQPFLRYSIAIGGAFYYQSLKLHLQLSDEMAVEWTVKNSELHSLNSRLISFCRRLTDHSIDECPLALVGNRLRRLNQNPSYQLHSAELRQLYDAYADLLPYLTCHPTQLETVRDVLKLGVWFHFYKCKSRSAASNQLLLTRDCRMFDLLFQYSSDGPLFIIGEKPECFLDNFDLYRLCLEYKMKPEEFDANLLFGAAKTGNLIMYKYFLETFPKKTAPMTIQIIEKAAGEMRYELIDFIFGATRLTDYIRRSAVTLFLQCAKPAISGGKAVCDNLAAKHLDVLCSDSRVLEIASKKGWSDTVNALLLAAKKGDKELQFGDSLKFAVKNGHEQTASVLIKHGASKGSIESSVLNRLSKVKRARIEEMLR